MRLGGIMLGAMMDRLLGTGDNGKGANVLDLGGKKVDTLPDRLFTTANLSSPMSLLVTEPSSSALPSSDSSCSVSLWIS